MTYQHNNTINKNNQNINQNFDLFPKVPFRYRGAVRGHIRGDDPKFMKARI